MLQKECPFYYEIDEISGERHNTSTRCDGTPGWHGHADDAARRPYEGWPREAPLGEGDGLSPAVQPASTGRMTPVTQRAASLSR